MDIPSYLMGRSAGSKNARTVVVNELPETGEPNIIYLVPKQTTGENDIFDEYIWVENDWELIGSTAIDISGKQDIMQFSTMPTADSTTVGKIIQYTGITNSSYTSGYFYVGINDNGSYSWTNINVQHTNPTEPQTYYIVADVGDITDSTTKTTINNLTLLNQIIDVLNDAYSNGYKTFELKIINDVDTLHAKYRVFRLIPQWNIQDTGSGEIEYEGFSFRSYDVYLNPPSTGRSPNVGMYYHNWEMMAQFVNGRFLIDSEATEIEVYSIPVSSLVQYNTMPTASSSTVGRIVQYVGTTTNDYTNGYFYIGTSTTTGNETTYGWSNVNVQPAPDTGVIIYDIQLNYTSNGWPSQYSLTNSEKNTLTNFVRDAYTRGYKFLVIRVSKNSSWGENFVLSSTSKAFNNLQSKPITLELCGLFCKETFTTYDAQTHTKCLVINMSWSNNVPTVTGATLTSCDVRLTTWSQSYNFISTVAGLSKYSSSNTYQIGDYIYSITTDNSNLSTTYKIYKCNTANTTGTWDVSKWTESTMIDYLSDTLIGSALGGSY